MRAEAIIGLDLSLTATGVATARGPECWSPKLTGMARLQMIRELVLTVVGETSAELVVIEGYSPGSKFGRESAGELGGIVRLALWEAGVAYLDVAPTRLKKFATGKGTADKFQMLAAAIHKLGYLGHNHNEADALWLRQMALVAYGHVNACKTTTARAAEVAWPATPEEAA